MKQLGKALKSQLQENLFDKYIRYDKQKNIVSFSPALMEMAADKARKSLGSNMQTFDLKPEGNALNFSLALKSGAHFSANIVPEALELGVEEMAIVGRLPQGLKIEGVDLQKTVSGFFDNLFGTSPSSPTSLSSLSSLSSSTISPEAAPSLPSSYSNLTDILKNFSVEGNTFRLKRPLKASTLGRALSSSMVQNPDGKTASTSQRLSLSMENGWLNLNLSQFNPEKILLQFTTENLLKQLQEK
ncbi:MAG: hypothetical protein WA705_25175 [Candidatus Ozemobacteraceae bacterium]